jgi:hypothetical protein
VRNRYALAASGKLSAKELTALDSELEAWAERLLAEASGEPVS